MVKFVQADIKWEILIIRSFNVYRMTNRYAIGLCFITFIKINYPQNKDFT